MEVLQDNQLKRIYNFVRPFEDFPEEQSCQRPNKMAELSEILGSNSQKDHNNAFYTLCAPWHD